MIEIKGLSKKFKTKQGIITALDGIDLTINDGEIFGIIGLSGAGKSTLVRCINLLERPTDGNVLVDGKDLTKMKKKDLLETRRSIGMIFQSYNLLEQRNALRNVLYPMEISGVKKEDAIKRAEELLELVGLSDRTKSYPSQLSGGQKQRVAIARALANKPKYLLCDEATSALDPNTTASILSLLKEINKTMGVTVIVITHEMSVIEKICDRVAVIDKSHIVETGEVKRVFANPESEIARELIMPKAKALDSLDGGKKLRLTFNGEASTKPVVANLVMECGVPVNILFADTKDINGCAYGQILISLPDNDIESERVIGWLDKNHPSYTIEK